MARSATLNPASMPFFPGNRSGDDEGNTVTAHGHPSPFRVHDQERSSVSSISLSPSDYRSVKSSPSPSHQEERTNISSFGHQSPPLSTDSSRPSPPFRQSQVDASRPFPGIESRIPRESSMIGSLDVFPEGEEQSIPGPDVGLRAIGSSSFFPTPHQRPSASTPPVAIREGNTAYSNATSFNSSSPVSSLDSGSQFTSSIDVQPQVLSFESQLKSSPLVHDILDRLLRCEYTTRDFHDRLVRCEKDIGDIHRKINIIFERSVAANSQPEFKDPFSSSNSTFNSTPRGSVGNIAPNQVAPSDDISSISQRLNTLTSSVGQLLALQTQQIQSSAAGISGLPLIASANQIDVNPTLNSNPGALGHGLPNRPDLRPSPRVPNPPMRTWSAGTLDLPIRGAADINNGSIRDNKRRSVSGLLRRDSSGVCVFSNWHISCFDCL